MLNFLKEANISNNVIELIEKNNTDNEIYALYCNQDECLKTIHYFEKIGIHNIGQLLIHEIQIFYNITSDIIKIFSQYDIGNLVKAINTEYTIIEQIM